MWSTRYEPPWARRVRLLLTIVGENGPLPGLITTLLTFTACRFLHARNSATLDIKLATLLFQILSNNQDFQSVVALLIKVVEKAPDVGEQSPSSSSSLSLLVIKLQGKSIPAVRSADTAKPNTDGPNASTMGRWIICGLPEPTCPGKNRASDTYNSPVPLSKCAESSSTGMLPPPRTTKVTKKGAYR
jgi:hypothetical protein